MLEEWGAVMMALEAGSAEAGSADVAAGVERLVELEVDVASRGTK